MHYQLDLVLNVAEGALLRVLGLVERRGFVVQSVQAQRNDEPLSRWHVQLVVSSTRSVETLRRQLEKVYDCQSIHVQPLSTDEGVAA